MINENDIYSVSLDSSDSRWHEVYTVEPINKYMIFLLEENNEEVR